MRSVHLTGKDHGLAKHWHWIQKESHWPGWNPLRFGLGRIHWRSRSGFPLSDWKRQEEQEGESRLSRSKRAEGGWIGSGRRSGSVPRLLWSQPEGWVWERVSG